MNGRSSGHRDPCGRFGQGNPGRPKGARNKATVAVEALLEAVAAGELTPEEAQAVGGVIETARRALETEDLERRIAALEEAG